MATALVLPGWGTPTDRLDVLTAGLVALGVDARPWHYEATGSIDRIARELTTAVGEASTAGPVHLVGHSLGGLASASAVLDHGASVASVTTINTPWRGTWVAWTAEPDESLGRELRWRSSRLARLRDRLEEHLEDPSGPVWHLVGAALDLATTPATSLRAPDGPRLRRSVVPVSGHSISLRKQRLVDEVVDTVAEVHA